MRKYLIYSTVTIIGLITIFIIYFSTYGIKTERFNNLILEKIKTYDSKLSIDINDVFLKLNVGEKSIKIKSFFIVLYYTKFLKKKIRHFLIYLYRYKSKYLFLIFQYLYFL